MDENFTFESNRTFPIPVFEAGGLSHKQILMNPKLRTLTWQPKWVWQ